MMHAYTCKCVNVFFVEVAMQFAGMGITKWEGWTTKNPEDTPGLPIYIAACSMWSILSCSLNNFQVKDIHMMKDHCVR